MLTIRKLKNIYIFYALFKTSDDVNSNKTLCSDISYIEEKYNIFFKNLPDTNENLFIKYHFHNKEVWDAGTEYMIRWNIDINEFLNSKEYPKWLFTFYLLYSNKESTYLQKKYSSVQYDNLLFKRLLIIYNNFFKSYVSISDKDLEIVLHDNLKEFVNYYFSLKENKFFLRNIYLNQLIKKGK